MQCGALYPVVDQSKVSIKTYSRATGRPLLRGDAIVFGDHTRIVKYIPSAFLPDGDGVRVLYGKYDDSRFLAYYISGIIRVPDIGYSRHFKYLLEHDYRLPKLPEQRAIAEVLSRFDEHLANLDEVIEKKRAIRDGALEDLLSGVRRLGGCDKPWASRSLDEIAHSRRESYKDEPIDVDVELENLLPGEGQIIGDTSVRTAASFIFRSGDVLFGRLRPYLKKYWLATCSGLRSGEIWALTAKDGIEPRFLFQLVRTQRFLDAAGKTMGTKMPRADWRLLKTEIFRVPGVEEQREIAEVLAGMDDEIRLLEEERAKVERVKRGAMEDLLTGRVRLPGEEGAA